MKVCTWSLCSPPHPLPRDKPNTQPAYKRKCTSVSPPHLGGDLLWSRKSCPKFRLLTGLPCNSDPSARGRKKSFMNDWAVVIYLWESTGKHQLDLCEKSSECFCSATIERPGGQYESIGKIAWALPDRLTVKTLRRAPSTAQEGRKDRKATPILL